MKKYNFAILILLSLLASCSTISPVKRGQSFEGHKILGSWTMDMNGCVETYDFLPSGIRKVTSNQEIVTAAYEISKSPLASGFYSLKDEVLEDNGKPDCSGSTANMSGDVVILFVRFHPTQNKFIVCQDENLNSCFGPFSKN